MKNRPKLAVYTVILQLHQGYEYYSIIYIIYIYAPTNEVEIQGKFILKITSSRLQIVAWFTFEIIGQNQNI